MTLKNRIEKLNAYFDSMNVSAENNIIYVRIAFPKGWGISEVTEHNYNVRVVKDEVPGYFYFMCEINVGFDNIFDAIEYNIRFNQEAQVKVNLLREKIEELKTIFEEEDITVLKTMEFKYKKKKETGKKNKKNNNSDALKSEEMDISTANTEGGDE